MRNKIPDTDCFIPFQHNVDAIELPQKFTFPFYYEPHSLAKIAVNELQDYLRHQSEWKHNFGLDASQEGLIIGKMFGVLVVKNEKNKLGYLAAFSGKLANSNHWSKFVPPVFDLLEDTGFFKKEEEVLNTINAKIESLQSSSQLQLLKDKLNQIQSEASKSIKDLEFFQKQAKSVRDLKRQTLTENDKYELEQLRKESVAASFYLKNYKKEWKEKVTLAEEELQHFQQQILQLQEERKTKSNALQNRIFEQYTFLNPQKELKSLFSIFNETIGGLPPAGAGECAAPKLLHYCFQKNLQPICMAEFWWGASPASEVRKHQQFYPACKGKCEPILKHMLSGIPLDDNPMIQALDIPKIPVLFEDDYLIVINKPSEFLSVPGKTPLPSVYSYFKENNPTWEGPIIVHRLDQSTSGIMVLSKDLRTYHHLQNQFIKRRVKKRYTAVLSTEIELNHGEINLPLRVDLEDRPRQMVCYKHGKQALTHYEVIKRENNKTWVYFYPHTGRTHQLRVHAAHILGLNAPIIGDDLYGTKDQRLLLHASHLEFMHPHTKEVITILCEATF